MIQSSVLPVTITTTVNTTIPINDGVNTATKVLAIIHLVIGGLMVILGICSIVFIKHHKLNDNVPFIEAIWIIVLGIIGLPSGFYETNTCLRGTYMSFNIISCIVAFIFTFIFGTAISDNKCKDWDYLSADSSKNCIMLTRGIYGALVVLSILEFAIALAASIVCCKSNNCCCPDRTRGNIIITQQPQGAVITQTSQGGYITQTQGGYATQQAGAYPQPQTIPVKKTIYPPHSYPNQPPPDYAK